jgi:DNA helicase-2/ATP-dependent DNA helicase PcrA
MDFTDDLLDGLTAPQQQAVTHTEGPLLVLAGPGSGKTRVLTRRVAHLARQGIDPASILAITFTNKAAGEMKNRIGSALGRRFWDFGKLDQPSPMVCTFHSLCLRILKHYAERLGLDPRFVIYDSSDQQRVIKDAIKALELSSSNFTPSTLHGTISNAKNQLQTAQDFARNAGDFYERLAAKVYLKYQQLLEAASALDFDDLLMRTVFGLRDHPDVLAELQERFQYLLIDEYQDTNRAQYLLSHALASKHSNICVVGDPDQSIYAWRGADLRNILDFERDYPDVVVVKLEQNYRSTKTILRAADSLIARNLRRKAKALFTENDAGEKVRLVIAQDEHDESREVARIARELVEKHGFTWGQIAVFYRVNALSRVVEDALRRDQIPYQIARGVEFYNRKEIKDTLSYLRVIINPRDDVALERIANTPTRGISDATFQTVQAWGVAHGMSTFDAMRSVAQIEDVNTRAQNAVTKFVAMVEAWRALEDVSTKSLMEKVLSESGLEVMYRKLDSEGDEQTANLAELVTSAAEFDQENEQGTLDAYLSQIALMSDADHMDGTGGAVTMMTLHAAKGLEFPAVIMVGLEEGLLPHSRARNSTDELEEERRLCFVGMTRAEKRLVLTHAQTRTIRGLRERAMPSPFLREIDASTLEVTDRTSFDSDGSNADFAPPPARNRDAPQRGAIVRHPAFGTGRVSEVSDMGSQTRVVVDFQRAGRKTLVLEYARLEVLG